MHGSERSNEFYLPLTAELNRLSQISFLLQVKNEPVLFYRRSAVVVRLLPPPCRFLPPLLARLTRNVARPSG